MDYRGMKDVSARSAFIVDGDGIVRGAWSYENAELPDFDVLLTAAQAV
jgi:peroxiredoxin